MDDKLWKDTVSASQVPFDTMHGYGHWLIKTMTLRRLRVDIAQRVSTSDFQLRWEEILPPSTTNSAAVI